MREALKRPPLSRLLDADMTWWRMFHVDRATWLSRALSLSGFGLAAYLTTVYLAGVPPVCDRSGGCVTVQHSSYAHLAGVPMPAIGLVGYALLFATACLPGQRARAAGMVLTVFAIGVSLGLTYIELEVIHALCLWCVASATCASLHVVVNSVRYVRGEPEHAFSTRPGTASPMDSLA